MALATGPVMVGAMLCSESVVLQLPSRKSTSNPPSAPMGLLNLEGAFEGKRVVELGRGRRG
eukprot:994079-Lingulodinium_polyedra.AAC.1